jgi:hypothetical protein
MKPKSDEAPTEITPRMEVTAGATRWYADEWDAFTSLCERREIKPTDQIRRLVRDVLADRYVSLNGLKPEVLAELQSYAHELGVLTQVAAERIIADFLMVRRRERANAKRAR